MKLIRVAAVGYGNVGRKAVEAILNAPDMELAGIVEVEKRVDALKKEVAFAPVVSHISKLDSVDVAVLSVDSRFSSAVAMDCLRNGINTVDPYDNYSEPILEYRSKLDNVAKECGTRSIICAGWDPGTDGMIRAVMEAIIPRGLTYTNFGPGQSMSHTAAAKTVEGVADAFSLTVPKGSGQHKRMVYVQLADNADFATVEKAILSDHHFNHDETYVIETEDVSAIADPGHGVKLERKGVTGKTPNHRAEFTMSIVNTATTSQIMVSSARAVLRQQPGCYFLPEIPPIDLLCGDRDALLKRLV